MTHAPEGTVALVFTDVESSTRLWERAPDAMSEAVPIALSAMRGALAEASGYEVKSEGDGLFATFEGVCEAFDFCRRAQEALNDAPWPTSLLELPEAEEAGGLRGLRVRMGVHLGEPKTVVDEVTGRTDYAGREVNMAARVASAAHGGQVLASEPAVAGARLDEGPPPRDLGLFRLSGLPGRHRLFEVDLPATPGRGFPPPRAEGAPTSNLPRERTSFVGRGDELGDLAARYGKGARLVTVTGPGGTGKTRLALRYAHGLADSDLSGGRWFCDLSEIRDLTCVAEEVAEVLGVPLSDSPDAEVALARVGGAVSRRGPLLLLLDNAEQAVDSVARAVDDLLEGAPDLLLLVTSRERLGVEGEVVMDLDPLPASEAALLLTERAEAEAGTDWEGGDQEAVREIVRQLEGLPLAIELAAARASVLPPASLLSRLETGFGVLGSRGRGSPRQATMSAAISWSWDLLDEHERMALAQCSVFKGGFTLDSAERVVALGSDAPPTLDVVHSLRDKSLLRAFEPPGQPGRLRFGMFLGIREFAEERLAETGAAEATRLRHATAMVEEGERLADLIEGSGGRRALEDLAQEADNIYTAAVAHGSSNPSLAARAALSLEILYRIRGPAAAHHEVVAIAEAAAREAGDDACLSAALRDAAWHHRWWGDLADAERLIGESLAAAERVGDKTLELEARRGEAEILWDRGDPEGSREVLEESRLDYERLGDEAGIAKTLLYLALLSWEKRAIPQAREECEEALRLAKKHGLQRYEAMALAHLGLVRWQERMFPEAEMMLRRALQLNETRGDRRLTTLVKGYLAWFLLETGTLEGAEVLAREQLERATADGDPRLEANGLRYFGWVAALQGREGEGIEAFERAVALHLEAGDHRTAATGLTSLAFMLWRAGRVDEAERRLDEAERVPGSSHLDGIRSVLAAERGDDEAAEAAAAAYEAGLEPEARAEADLAMLVAARRAAKARHALGAGDPGTALEKARESLAQAWRLFEGEDLQRGQAGTAGGSMFLRLLDRLLDELQPG